MIKIHLLPSLKAALVLSIGALVLGLITMTASVEDAAATSNPSKIWIDADTGTDDGLAIAWLLKNPNADIVGISTVAGNTSVDNATRNTLSILGVAGESVPVVQGSDKPLVVDNTSINKLIHGPDGLWFYQQPVDTSGVPTNAPEAIVAAAQANPGMTIIILGPATNIAKAVELNPTAMQNVKMIMVATLNGSETSGSFQPGGFNVWYDPEAFDKLLKTPGLDLTIFAAGVMESVTTDSVKYPERLTTEGGALGQYVGGFYGAYANAITQGVRSQHTPWDAVAAVLAVRPDLAGSSVEGVGKVSTNQDVTQGQIYFRSEFFDKVTLIASRDQMSTLADRAFTDPDFDLGTELFMIVSSQPNNVKVITDVKDPQIEEELEKVEMFR